MFSSKQSCMVRTNKVAPVIIKDCREEFQQFLDLNEPIVNGSLADGMLEHPLIKGQYILVQDMNDVQDVLQTLPRLSAPNFQQASPSLPVFSSGQPTLAGLNTILDQLLDRGYKDILVLNLRGEPVLFQRVDEDLVSYSLRHRGQLHNMVVMADTRDSCDLAEARIRREIVSIASIQDEFVFCFYDDLEALQFEPHVRKVEFEEDIILSAEVYARQAFANQSLRYDRICLTENGIPTEEVVDQFLSHFKEDCSYLDRSSQKFPAVYLVSHSGGQRSAIVMVMTCLLVGHVRETLPQTCPEPTNREQPDYKQGEFMAVQKLVSHIQNGALVKHQVDTAIDQCSQVINLRTCIADHKEKLEQATDSMPHDSGGGSSLYFRCLSALETYCFLISFNAYLHDQMPNKLCWTFSKWLHRNPHVIRLSSQLDFSELSSRPSLLATQKRFLVADDYVGLDVLSSQMDVKVSNFRRMMGLPIYGMAQPTRNGLSKVVNQLLQPKQGYSSVVVVNLRSDYVLEADDLSYSLRDVSFLAEPIYSYCSSGKQLEERELTPCGVEV